MFRKANRKSQKLSLFSFVPMGTNCAPLLADLFLYSYEAEFVQSLLLAGRKHLAQQFNFTYRYIDDVLSSFRPMGMVGEACLPSNAYYPRPPDYTLYSGVHVC